MKLDRLLPLLLDGAPGRLRVQLALQSVCVQASRRGFPLAADRQHVRAGGPRKSDFSELPPGQDGPRPHDVAGEASQ